MNSEELKKEFGLLMPSEINGFKRPDESISSSNDFFLEIPQLISKDPVLYSTMNLIFSVILSNDKLLKQWIDTLQNVVNAQDWRIVTDTLKGYMTPELKKKLDGIATGANNYVHPSTHPATMITQDATHRFVTDNEKNTWNAKASTAVVSTTANGLMPKRNGNASYIFTGDGVWKSLAWNLITGKPSTFPPSTHNHDSSYLKRDNNNKNDLNSCTVEGIYRFSGTLTGGWTGTSWGTLLVLNNQYNGGSGISGTYLVQLAFPTDNTIRMRQRVNTGAWSSWVTLARTSDNITSATKATQDSRGQQIDTTYVKGVTGSNATLTVTKGNGTTSTVTINNVGNSTKATQDKNGKDITGYLYKTEDLTLNSNAEILTVGNISEILNSFCTKFKNIQGTASYGENSPTTLKSLNDNKAPKASPAFSGSPTTPTPSASDNSTKIPNTSWVQTWVKSFINNLSGNLQVTWDGNKYTIPSLGITGLSDINNGYISFGKLFGGLILQYGLTNSYLGNYPYAACNVNFPINFTKNYIIFAMHSGTQPVMINELYTSHTLSKTVLEAIAYDGSKSPNWIINWVAIGY